MHNEQLHVLHSSPYIVRVIISRTMGWAGHKGRRIVGEIEGKNPLGRSSRRWEDIKGDVKGRRCDEVEWIHLGQDGVSGGLLLTQNEGSGTIKRLEFVD